MDQPKVFISYSSKDGDIAELMKMKLEDAGIEVWRDIHEIAAGEEWRNEIDYGLLNAEALIVLLNQNAAASSYVTYEWAFALGNGKPVIPILLETCELHPRIKVLQYLDFTAQKRPWSVLIERVKQLAAPKSSQQNNKQGLSLEQIIDGIKSLANAKAAQSDDAKGPDFSRAAAKMISATNYLNTVENRLHAILWVDDHPNNQLFEREAFQALGFTFDLAATTAEALELFQTKSYAAIISDMGRAAGPQEGYVLLKEVRQADKDTPFFIYSGSNSLEHKIMAQERGAQGATNRVDELIDLVTTHIRPQSQ